MGTHLENMRKVFDIHTHVYPDAIAQKAAAALGSFYHFEPHGGGTFSDFLEDGRGVRQGFLLLGVATNAHQVPKVNRFLAQCVNKALEQGYLAYGFAGLHQDTKDMTAALESARRDGLCGLKLHPDIQGVDINDKRLYPAYDYLCQNHLPLCLHMGDDRPAFQFSAPEKLLALLRDFPHLRVLAAHFGGYREAEHAAEVLYQEKELFFDTSSTLRYLPPQTAKRLLWRMDPDRICFGTDYPVFRLDEELALLGRLGLADDFIEKIVWENAFSFLENVPCPTVPQKPWQCFE